MARAAGAWMSVPISEACRLAAVNDHALPDHAGQRDAHGRARRSATRQLRQWPRPVALRVAGLRRRDCCKRRQQPAGAGIDRRAYLIDEPPTSTPNACCSPTSQRPLRPSAFRGRASSRRACISHADTHHAEGHDQHHDGGQCVDAGIHAEPHLGVDHHRQRVRARARTRTARPPRRPRTA